ncbi:MT-A70-domain-containing protein [Pleomassaria siparia CBS 279.74]|uniref:MT-A70-domain-containing protein n=1 Tax=Pleomassaria siparia CBS 279.74 TaxID=1314801 RepID=A0A6G1K2F7_9PLEO|nr:MT-A70-domain-containing protein [Pleomassaria siparia CBS 279.74]
MRTSILYQNPEHDVTLIDIPTSIAVAQGGTDYSDTLLSNAPLDKPFVLQQHQPKNQMARQKHAIQLSCVDKHVEYRAAIEKALSTIQVPGAWCVPRRLTAQVPCSGKKAERMDMDDLEKELESRLREWSALGENKRDDAFDFQKMMASVLAGGGTDATWTEKVAHKWYMSHNPTGTADRSQEHDVNPKEPWTAAFHNGETHASTLAISDGSSQYRFKIPPRSTLFLSDSTHSDAFRASFRELTEEYTLPRHFDLILLDPPWPNGSAKRKGAYEQVGGMPYMMKVLSKMDIDSYVEQNALVGIWITNKESLRHHVLGPGGLFEKWNVGLIEEWIWIKTTTKGEPMFSLENLWRKPYEIFLLGRAAPNSWTKMVAAGNIKKKVIAAVPDIHSRKPCLKELLEPYMSDTSDYSALEIFSRYLVAGWTSWGNEVIKFNWDKYWAPDSGDSDTDTRVLDSNK